MSAPHHHGDHAGHRHEGPAPAADSAADRLAGRAREGRRLLGAIALTATIFVAEIIGGLASGYLALVADAGHMLSDVAAQVVSLFALYIASRPTDRRRTYGWYRVEILAALVNGAALLALAVGIAWSALGRLHDGPRPVAVGLAMVIAAIGLLANLAGAWLLHGAQSLNVRGAYLHVLQDTLSSVAVLGGGVVLALRPGWWMVDPLLSIAIAVFVSVGALRLLRDAVDVLLEAVPLGIDLDAVSAALRGEAVVREVHDLHLWTITSGVYALSAHIVIDGGSSSAQDELLDRLRQSLLSNFRIRHTTIQVESSEYRAGGYHCERCEE